jgi:RNA polymerase sigma-70 factor (ECF subfamily)
MSERVVSREPISIAALKRGDRQEIARMVEEYSSNIYRLGMKMLGNEQDAEDVLQETFLKAIRALANFEERSSLSTWLYRIAMNETLMMLRKQKGGVVSVDEETETEDGTLEPVEIVDWCCLPEKELVDSEARRHLNRAVQGLSPVLRSVFVLRDIEGLSVRETAETLNVSEAAVKTRLLRARMQLRDNLSGYYGRRMNGQERRER